MNKNLIIFGIAVLLVCVGLSGCFETNQDTTNDTDGGATPSNGNQDEEQYTTLPDGTNVTGDIDKVEILSYSVATERKLTYEEAGTFLPTYEKIADGFQPNLEKASRYNISGTVKNIAGEMLNEIDISVNFYDSNDIYLYSITTSKSNLPNTYTWDFIVVYMEYYDYFEDVDHISFEISAVESTIR